MGMVAANFAATFFFYMGRNIFAALFYSQLSVLFIVSYSSSDFIMWTFIEGFQRLQKEEIDALVEAPALITILVGAADGELDSEERTWSERLLRTRTYNKPKELNEFYRVVVEGFWAKIQSEIAHLPTDMQTRNRELSERLSRLNPILAKLDIELAADLYKGFVGLAEETAKASGGFLRIGAIGFEESKWVKLPMLTPVIMVKEQNEDDQETAENG